MVSGYEPRGVEAAVAIVSVVEPPTTTDGGLNDAVAFPGRPLTEKVTVGVAPAVAVWMLVLTEPPGGVSAVDGVAVMSKAPPPVRAVIELVPLLPLDPDPP